MYSIVGDSIDPGGLAHSSFSKYEDIDVVFFVRHLKIKNKRFESNQVEEGESSSRGPTLELGGY